MLIRNAQGQVIGSQDPHQRAPVDLRVRNRRSRVFQKLGHLACWLAEFGGNRWRAWMFSFYRWAENRSEILMMPPPLTLQQKLENSASLTEYFDALQKQSKQVN